MPDCFISYSTRDQKMADFIYSELVGQGLDVFMASVKVAAAVVRTLEKGDEHSLLAEALTTQGIALARTSRHVRARAMLQRAAEIAEQAGDHATAGRAALTIIEELSEHATRGELCTIYEQAADDLAKSQHPSVTARLIAGARLVIRRLKPQRPAPEDAPANECQFRLSVD